MNAPVLENERVRRELVLGAHKAYELQLDFPSFCVVFCLEEPPAARCTDNPLVASFLSELGFQSCVRAPANIPQLYVLSASLTSIDIEAKLEAFQAAFPKMQDAFQFAPACVYLSSTPRCSEANLLQAPVVKPTRSLFSKLLLPISFINRKILKRNQTPKKRARSVSKGTPAKLSPRLASVLFPSSLTLGSAESFGPLSTSQLSIPSPKNPQTKAGLGPAIKSRTLERTISFLDLSGQSLRLLYQQPKQLDVSTYAFDFSHCLGEGVAGQVFMGIEESTGNKVAVKRIAKVGVSNQQMRLLRNEIEIHGRLAHPNIIRQHGFAQDDEFVYIILEFAQMGNLGNILSKRGRFPEAEAAKCIGSICCALQYLHADGIFHRDVKLENIFVDQEGTLKLGDFGACGFVESFSTRQTICGTMDYLSPEVLNNAPYNEKVDMWSLGVLAYELLVGKSPFSPSRESNDAIARNIQTMQYSIPSCVSRQPVDLIRKLLVRDTTRRLSAAEVLRHPWIMAYSKA